MQTSALSAALKSEQTLPSHSPVQAHNLSSINLPQIAFPCLYYESSAAASVEHSDAASLAPQSLRPGRRRFRSQARLSRSFDPLPTFLTASPPSSSYRPSSCRRPTSSPWRPACPKRSPSSSAVASPAPRPRACRSRRLQHCRRCRTLWSSFLHWIPAINCFVDTLQDAVAAPTPAGRKLRQRLASGMVVVCVVAGYSGKRFVYERAHALGLRLVMLDSADCWARTLEEEGIVERYVAVDFEVATAFEQCLHIITGIEKELGQVDAVLTFFEFAARLVALLAERLGLPGNPPSAVVAAQNKQETRKRMTAAGLPTPAHAEINEEGDVLVAADKVSFPAVLKPVSGGASQGVVRVDSIEDLYRAFHRERARFLSEMETDGGAFGQGSKGLEPALRFMLEAYLDGPEVDVDLVLSCGKPVYGNVTDNWPTVEPYFNETGSNCPSQLPATPSQQDLLRLSVAALQCLGFECGVFHVECKLTSQHGAQLIEINPRLGGGPVALMNELVWAVDLVEEHFFASLGIPSQPCLSMRPLVYVAEYTINCPRSGILEDNNVIECWQGTDEVVYCRALEGPGTKVVGPQEGLPTWLAEVMVTSKVSLEAAIAKVNEIEADLAEKIAIRKEVAE